MSYTISQLRVRNFKCFDSKKFYEFNFYKDRNPTILSGPNGFGKTTFFDAVELIFTKKITRLQTSIEDKRINLGKNILLNEADKNGNLILTLIDENSNYITIVAVIDNQVQKLFIEESIKYSVIEGTLNSEDDIEGFLSCSKKWELSLDKFEKLRYSLEHFNVYYYVSQAESVHFLKNSISNRKDSMNALLNTTTVDSYLEYIENEVVGKSKTKKGVVINDGISSSNEIINTKIKLLKSKIQGSSLALEKVQYSQLLEYPKDIHPIEWDLESPSFNNRYSGIDLNSAISEIRALHNFAINIEDYKNYLHNEKLNIYINNKTVISDYIEFYQYIENNIISKIKVSNLISDCNKLIDVYNHSGFFRKELEVASYKKEDLIKLKEITDNLISANIEEISEIVFSINDTNKTLSKQQNMLNELDKSRIKLHQIKRDFNDKSSNCPYCNHKYDTVEELEQSFISLSNTLSEEKSGESKKIQTLNKLLRNKLQKDLDAILSILQGVDEQKIRELSILSAEYKQFIEDEKRIKAVEAIYPYLINSDSWSEFENNEKLLEIQRVLQGNLKNYNNLDFINDMEKYNFISIFKKYSDLFSILQPKVADKNYIEEKVKYLQYMNALFCSTEINSLRDEIKREILKLKKLEAIRVNIEKLKNVYQDSISDYKNQILKKLRVPLLIYTGKILQDYQSGLGVFVSKDEMRFVANGDAKHDILNTFSSGQLSGFVLAFLFSMNKQYIMKSEDDIGFILVDDPVQTMDDINISSLIEVLRNDFSNKQIIISTHETDKENYILYKFLKYNLIGQSFNVREKLYT